MKYYLLSLLLIGVQLVTGQSVDSVSKIIFVYSKGHSSWGQTGVFSKEEKIEISSFLGHYKMSEYQLITHTNNGGNKSISDTSNCNVEGFRVINKAEVEKLFIALNSTKDNFNTDFVMPYLIKPSKRTILSIAEKIDKYWQFTNEYSDKEDRAKWIKKMQRFDKLDLFLLINKPNPDEISVTVDAWNNMRIYCISKNDTIKFGSELYKLMGQPVEKFKKGSYDFDKGVVNLEINAIITDILPESSFLRENIAIGALREEYIKWYIKEKL